MPHNRVGATMSGIFGQGNASPGSYEVDIKDNVRTKPTSIKGYSLGARTAQRQGIAITGVVSPGPAAYEQILANKKSSKCNYKPFNQSSDRFPEPPKSVGEVAGPKPKPQAFLLRI
ncbi:unnamed protein product [Echinostoma caproni]|uniref:PDZ domain-containing protein n=1 Tax=Echinostoma caproni TaxID=27848 RepID=A0A183AF80_9TREM|nr:unnamed protein product [Echinostoma caproni]